MVPATHLVFGLALDPDVLPGAARMTAEANRWRGAWVFAVFMFAIAVADTVLYYHATGTLGRLDIALATAIVIAQWAVERRKADPNPDAIFATLALLLLTCFGG